MADSIESEIAAKLREIADKVAEWERRDMQEAIAAGNQSASWLLYYDDLRIFAGMLEGKNREHRLVRTKPTKGRRVAPETVDRDLAIARFIAPFAERRGGVKDGIEAAAKKFAVSEGLAKKAWLRMKPALIPGNEEIFPFFMKLAARGHAVATPRTKKPKK